MKYIRTEDGIYEVNGESRHLTFIDGEKVLVNNKSILAQADTIEELCDEVVLIDEKHKKPKWLLDKPKDIANFNELPTAYKNRINKGTFMLKFGIWTEKGLIYVAKMNSDGKLVLI